MTNVERFRAVARFEKPDYVPIFGFRGAPGMAWGCQGQTRDRLVATGMPANAGVGPGGWDRYWGTIGHEHVRGDFYVAQEAPGFRTTIRREGEFEIIESESGEITRQVLDNDNTYSMPEFIRHPVRDRASWEFYKERTTPRAYLSREQVLERARQFERRDLPLVVDAGSTYGVIRELMGPEALSLAFYDDPELVHDMADWELRQVREHVFPLIERIKPEVVDIGEDVCYNHGMLVSPAQFDEFFGRHYREVCGCALASGVPMVAVDTDGNAMEFVSVVARYGVNAVFPFEVKGGNDLFALRRAHPRFICFGWLEKEVVNEGNGAAIRPEIMSKVPALLEQGGYYPNGDHGLQPLVTFPNLCKFMTLLHEVCGNPEGEFPRG